MATTCTWPEEQTEIVRRTTVSVSRAYEVLSFADDTVQTSSQGNIVSSRLGSFSVPLASTLPQTAQLLLRPSLDVIQCTSGNANPTTDLYLTARAISSPFQRQARSSISPVLRYLATGSYQSGSRKGNTRIVPPGLMVRLDVGGLASDEEDTWPRMKLRKWEG